MDITPEEKAESIIDSMCGDYRYLDAFTCVDEVINELALSQHDVTERMNFWTRVKECVDLKYKAYLGNY